MCLSNVDGLNCSKMNFTHDLARAAEFCPSLVDISFLRQTSKNARAIDKNLFGLDESIFDSTRQYHVNNLLAYTMWINLLIPGTPTNN